LISKWVNGKLGPDEVTRYVCRNLRDFGIKLIHGAEGFLVIESTLADAASLTQARESHA